MGLLDTLKTAYANKAPTVDRDDLHEDVAFLKDAVNVITGTVAEVEVGGETVTPAQFSNGCCFFFDMDPAIELEAGTDTSIPMNATPDLYTGVGTDVVVVDGVMTVVTPGVYVISWHAAADVDAADHTAARLITFTAYLEYNDEAVGPFYNFIPAMKGVGDSFVNPLSVSGSIGCYLSEGDTLIPVLNLAGPSISDDGTVDQGTVYFQRVA